MPDSPLSASPYEVLGVAPTATEEELRKAYRRLLRETHPDTGGTAERFTAVQRAWTQIGSAAGRARFDAGRPAPEQQQPSWAPAAPRPRQNSRPVTRAYGHPGGFARERYLHLIREWVGRGEPLPDPYDATLVRSAPREIRHALADAMAEEATARAITSLGIGYTVWHDVVAGPRGGDDKIDHVVLGPTGLFAVASEDWASAVKFRKGDLIAPGVDTAPLHALAGRARVLGRRARVSFTVAAIALPDDDLEGAITVTGKARGMALVAVRLSVLPHLLRTGVTGAPKPDGTELFEIRTRLQNTVSFV